MFSDRCGDVQLVYTALLIQPTDAASMNLINMVHRSYIPCSSLEKERMLSSLKPVLYVSHWIHTPAQCGWQNTEGAPRESATKHSGRESKSCHSSWSLLWRSDATTYMYTSRNGGLSQRKSHGYVIFT
jgi:hypothetical protein